MDPPPAGENAAPPLKPRASKAPPRRLRSGSGSGSNSNTGAGGSSRALRSRSGSGNGGIVVGTLRRRHRIANSRQNSLSEEDEGDRVESPPPRKPKRASICITAALMPLPAL